NPGDSYGTADPWLIKLNGLRFDRNNAYIDGSVAFSQFPDDIGRRVFFVFTDNSGTGEPDEINGIPIEDGNIIVRDCLPDPGGRLSVACPLFPVVYRSGTTDVSLLGEWSHLVPVSPVAWIAPFGLGYTGSWSVRSLAFPRVRAMSDVTQILAAIDQGDSAA